jgi:RNA polymerase sigma-70 factor (ECF subfamily)
MQDDFNRQLVELLPRLRAYAVVLTKNRSAADDLLQQTAYKALRARGQFTPGTNFTAWVHRILHNEFISSKRRINRIGPPVDELPEELVATSGNQESKLLSKEVIRAMDELQPSQREVLVMICGAGLSYEEAAEALGCSVGTVKSRLWRARRHMQELIMGDEVLREQAGIADQTDAPAREDRRESRTDEARL